MTELLKIHKVPKETEKLFSKTLKKFKKANENEFGFCWKYFEDHFEKEGFVLFSGHSLHQVLIQAEERKIKELSLIRPKSKIQMGFSGNPEQMKKELEKIFQDLERKEKLGSFK